MTTAEVADPCLGIAAYLKADSDINTATAGRIYRPELSTHLETEMPEAVIVVRPSGGGVLLGRTYLPVIDSRIDVVCYGGTRLEAETIARMVAYRCKELRREKVQKCILFWARIVSNVGSVIDPETNWPYAVVVLQVMHGIEDGT